MGNVKAPLLFRAAAYAAATATGEPRAASRSSTAVLYALEAIKPNGDEAFKSILNALAVDAGLLEQRFSPVAFAHSKLWPVLPQWVQDAWPKLTRRLLAADESWRV